MVPTVSAHPQPSADGSELAHVEVGLVEAPEAQILACERELNTLQLEQARLKAAWPKGATPLARAATGRAYEDAPSRVGELQVFATNEH